MKEISRRLHRLEDQFRPSLEARRQAGVTEGRSGAEVLRGILARMEIEPEAGESLAAATARGLGISCQELKRQLMMRAGS